MAKFLSNLDLSSNQIQNVVVHKLTTAPTGVAGQIYYDKEDELIYLKNDSAWVALNTGSGDITGVTFSADGGSDLATNSGAVSLDIAGGTGITTAATSGTVTINVDAAQTGITSIGTITTGTWQGTTIAINQGGTGATNSNGWLNSRVTTSADGSLNYDATTAVAVNHDSLAGFASNEHFTQANITTVGTIGTGVWQGTTIAIDQGGTGATDSNGWLNSRVTTNADGTLNYDATAATAVNHDSLAGFASNEHFTQANITTVGTVGTGVWNGTDIASDYIADNAITLAKLAGIARGKIIVGDASGDPSVLAAGGNGKVLVADANGDPSWTTMSGDGTMSAGALTITQSTGDFTVTGNLIVSGDTTTLDVGNLLVEDPLIGLAKANPADSLDIGIWGQYTATGAKYSGLFRDASDSGIWKLFATTGNTNETPGTGTTINTDTGFTYGDLKVNNIDAATTTFGAGTVALAAITTGALPAAITVNNGNWSGADLAIGNGGTGASNSNAWLNSRITTSADGTLNYDATTAVAVNHDSLAGFASNEHFTQANITTVGTIGTGVWNGTSIAIANGGTGAANSNAWLNSRVTTSADGSLNYDATTAVAVNHDSLAGFASNEHFTQANITTTGTIGTGVWNGTAIGASYMATAAADGSAQGAVTLATDAEVMAGTTTDVMTVARFSKRRRGFVIIKNSLSADPNTVTIHHGFGHNSLLVDMYDSITGENVYADVHRTLADLTTLDLNKITIAFGAIPDNNIIGVITSVKGAVMIGAGDDIVYAS